MASGVEFVGDVIASTFVLLGMILGSRPADENHPYGHGRIEILAGLTVGIILAGGGVGICYRSLERITETHSPPGAYAIWPLIGAMVIRGSMATFKFRAGRRIGSVSLIADAWNDAVDILSAVAALVALCLTLFDPGRYLAADHYGGFAVGLFVIYTGVRVLRDASMDLIDTMPKSRDHRRHTARCRSRRGRAWYGEMLRKKDRTQVPRRIARRSRSAHDRGRIRMRWQHRSVHTFGSALPSVGDVIVHIEPTHTSFEAASG